MANESTTDEQRDSVAVRRLVRRLLVEVGLVDAEAIDDPEGYDAGITQARADQMARRLTHVCPVNRPVRLHFFGDDFKGIVELPELVALTAIQSAADQRLASVLALVAEHDREADADERANIRRTLSEIVENAPVLLSNVASDLSPEASAEGD